MPISSNNTVNIPTSGIKKYNAIYADPPWDTKYLSGGKTQGSINTNGAFLPYPTMSDKQLALLPIPQIAHDDCLLFVWCIDNKIPILPALLKAWGFSFNSIAFIWNKSTKHDPDTQRFTLNYYTKRSCEYCFLATKGNPSNILKPPKERHVLQFINQPTPDRQHSRKPQEVKNRINAMLKPNTLKVELFSRENQPLHNWDNFGNQSQLSTNIFDFL